MDELFGVLMLNAIIGGLRMKTVYEKSYVCIDSEYMPGTKVWAADGIRLYSLRMVEGEIIAEEYEIGTKVSIKIECKD